MLLVKSRIRIKLLLPMHSSLCASTSLALVAATSSDNHKTRLVACADLLTPGCAGLLVRL
jgi:hypothetical protein